MLNLLYRFFAHTKGMRFFVVKIKKGSETMENEKVLLSIKEASELSGIGQSKLYELCRDPRCEFVIKLGDKKLKKNLK